MGRGGCNDNGSGDLSAQDCKIDCGNDREEQ